MNHLYYGDNLDVLRRYIDEGSVDLVYLDPPFNSNANYNILFAEQDGTRSAAQIHAFEDTWQWDQAAAAAYQEVVEAGGQVSLAMQAFRQAIGDNDLLAYLAMMAPRLVELRRVMKETASIYLHCDPTASHYLKILMDAIFGTANFRSEIVWKRSSAHSDTKQGRKMHGHIHDVLFFYTRSDEWTWNPIYTEYDEEYVADFYRFTEADTGRRYRVGDLTAAKPGGDTSYEWRVKQKSGSKNWESDLDEEYKEPREGWEYKGVGPYNRRFWAYSKANMAQYAKQGRLVFNGQGMPGYKRYLDEMPGVPLQDLWTDIQPIAAAAAERLGYPTQKPVALLERIVQSSTNEGDVVLDPFCGCGTTIAAVQKLKRQWIGIDITNLAISLIKHRLQNAYGSEVKYKITGEPVSVSDAEQLAHDDPYQFQWWALGLVGARPVEQKKGADQGIDGRLFFHDEAKSGKTKQIIFSVKAGHTNVAHVRDLRGVLDRESAAIGVLITMQDPTAPMRKEAASTDFYDSPWGTRHPKIQICTVGELLEGKRLDFPQTRDLRTFRLPPKAQRKSEKQKELDI